MYHETIQKLLNISDHIEFERMMCDILSSIGYKNIDPQSPGMADGGKDALHYSDSEKIVFAFSLRKDWRTKFNSDYKLAKDNKLNHIKFVFCSNQSIPALERDKIIKEKKKKNIDVEFYDLERIRVLLDTELKKIRQIYLGIHDNTVIRRKIRNILFDPQNEVTPLERWEILSLVTPLEMTGVFEVIKDADLSAICETHEEMTLLNQFLKIFIKLRKGATNIDNYIHNFIGDNIDNNFPDYWRKVGEYSKLSLLGCDVEKTEKRIKTWHITSGFGDCKNIYKILKDDSEINKMINDINNSVVQSIEIINKIKQLDGFKF